MTAPAGLAGRRAPSRPILLQRDFALYWFTSLLATSGTWLWRITSPVMMFELTSSPVMLGLLSLASYGPILTLSLVGGVLADRFPRRVQIAAAHGSIVALMLVLAVMARSDSLGPSLLFAAALLEGIAFSLAKPALQALVTELVEPDEVSGAVAINVVQFSIAQLIGPGIATALLLVGGHSLTLTAAAATHLPLVLTVFVLRSHNGAATGHTAARVGELFRGGLAALRLPTVMPMLIAIAFGSMALEGAVRVLAPQFATDVLDLDESTAGLIISSQAAGSIASVVVVTLAARRHVSLQVAHRACFVMAAAIVGYALAPNLPVALAIAVFVGGAQTVSFSVATGMIHHAIPTEARGRVMAFHAMALLGVRPLAGLLAGLLASVLSTRLASGLFLAFALGGAVIFGRFRVEAELKRPR